VLTRGHVPEAIDPMQTVLIAVSFMTVLGLTLATVVVVANRRLYVFEDPRIDQVEDLLPHANCGACGTAGCRPFAEMLVKGEVEPGRCTVNSKDMNQVIADFLGVDLGAQEKRVARLACAGGAHVAFIRAGYAGLESCRAATLVSGGGKGCAWGCLGLGDCESACDFEAIRMDRHGVPVVSEANCTACGDCVDVCPKDLFVIRPVSHRLVVQCRSLLAGDEALALCKVACTGCGICAADAPEGLIEMEFNLPVIDFSVVERETELATVRCPTGAIKWVVGQQFPELISQAEV